MSQIMRKTLILLTSALIVLSLHACKDHKPDPGSEEIEGTRFRRDASLTFSSPDGTPKARFEVEIASTPRAITQGLMFRESMAPNQGMLFDPEGLSDNGFWMKNTYIPLDMIFIDDQNRVMSIARDTKPFSTELIPPGGVYRYVLEINAGQADQQNLVIGDKIEWTKE